jgi:hypothetical protein
MKASTSVSVLLATLAFAGCGEVVSPGGGDSDGPTATEVSPDHGPVIGGIEVTVTGTGFGDGEVQVVVGGVAAEDVTVASNTSLTFTLPPGLEEGDVVDVTVFNQNGFSTLVDAFRFNEQPIIIDVQPKYGRQAGGSEVTITGRGFESLEAGDATVTIAGVDATSVTVVDDETLTATLGAAPSVLPFTFQDVVVTNDNGSDILEGAFKLTRPGLLVTDRCCTNALIYVDPADGYVAEVGRMTRRVHGLALSATGQLYAVSQRDGNFFQELVNVDPVTLNVTTVAQLRQGTTPWTISELGFVNGTLYGVTSRTTSGSGDQRLVSINLTTGAVTPIGVSLPNVHPVALAPRDGTTAWYLDDLRQTVDFITLATGVVTAGAALNGNAFNVQNTGVTGLDIVDGTLYATERFGGRRLFSVNTGTGALTEIARLPIGPKGLCETPPSF